MTHFTLRDVFWLTLVVAVFFAWRQDRSAVDRRRMEAESDAKALAFISAGYSQLNQKKFLSTLQKKYTGDAAP